VNCLSPRSRRRREARRDSVHVLHGGTEMSLILFVLHTQSGVGGSFMEPRSGRAMLKTERRRKPDRSAACTHEDQMLGRSAVCARSLDQARRMGAGRRREDLTPPCMHGARTHSLLAYMHMHLVHAMHLHTSKQGGRGHASMHKIKVDQSLPLRGPY
jgi:hypothetical protein